MAGILKKGRVWEQKYSGPADDAPADEAFESEEAPVEQADGLDMRTLLDAQGEPLMADASDDTGFQDEVLQDEGLDDVDDAAVDADDASPVAALADAELAHAPAPAVAPAAAPWWAGRGRVLGLGALGVVVLTGGYLAIGPLAEPVDNPLRPKAPPAAAVPAPAAAAHADETAPAEAHEAASVEEVAHEDTGATAVAAPEVPVSPTPPAPAHAAAPAEAHGAPSGAGALPKAPAEAKHAEAPAAHPAAAPSAAEPVAAAAAQGAVAVTGYAVQVAAVPTEADAAALRQRLAGGGYPAYTEPVTNGSSQLVRVRVGPVMSRAAARDIAKRLEADGFASTWIVSSSISAQPARPQ